MSVSSTISLEVFDGNGSTTTPYPISIEYSDSSQIKVLVDGLGISTFSLAADGLRTDPAIASGSTVIVYRDTPKTQGVDFPANTTPSPEDVEAGLDKITQMVQEVTRRLPATSGKALTFPVTEPSASDTELTSKSGRVSTVLGFDTNGDLVHYPISSLGVADPPDLDILRSFTTISSTVAVAIPRTVRKIIADVDTAGGDITIDLPAEATAQDGWDCYIVQVGTAGNVIVRDDAGVIIYTHTADRESKVYHTDGTNWFL